MPYARMALGLALAGAACFAQSEQPAQTSNSGYQALLKDAKSRIKETTVPELQSMMKSDTKVVLIDVREDNEWQAGHASSAVHIGRGVLERQIEAAVPKKDANIVLYCGSGARSALAADSLQKMGYTNVSSLAGGFSSYRGAGLPVQAGSSQAGAK